MVDVSRMIISLLNYSPSVCCALMQLPSGGLLFTQNSISRLALRVKIQKAFPIVKKKASLLSTKVQTNNKLGEVYELVRYA